MSQPSSIEDFLVAFRGSGAQPAVIWRNRTYTYNELLARIDHWKKELSYIKSGSIVGLEGDFSPESIAIMFVLIDLNTIVIPFDINQAEKNGKKYQIAQLDMLISLRTETNVSIEKLAETSPKNALYDLIKQRATPGLVLFTSGSSGEPKAALHDFAKLLQKFNVKRRSLRTINFLLFDHWGGLNTLFHVLSNSGTVVLLENRNPDYVCELIEKHNVELLPTSPTFLNMLILSRAYERKSLKSLKLITYGSEPMPQSLLKHLNQLFPEIRLQQTYGLIELGVMRSQSENSSSLWVKIGGEGYQSRVVEGILQIKSDSAMVGYLNATSPFTNDGWFITGDSVEVNGDYFKILGRKSEIINVGGEKVFPQEIENIILELPFIKNVLVYGEDNRLTGKIVCAKVECNTDEEPAETIKKIKTHCRLKLQSFKVPVKVTITETDLNSHRFKKNRKDV